MKCSYCESENAEDGKFCGECGFPLKSTEAPLIRWQKRMAKQTAIIIALISILLLVIAFGIKSQGDEIHQYFEFGNPVSHAFYNTAWLVALLGIAGFFIAGFAYLLSLPIPVTKKEEVKDIDEEVRKDGEAKGG